MKNLTYILITILLILGFGLSAFGQTPTTIIRYYGNSAFAPTTCDSANRKHALIYVSGIGLKKCVGNVYVLAEGSGGGRHGRWNGVGNER